MSNLDGTDVINATPFDAHEQIVRGPHEVVQPVYGPEDIDNPDRGHLKTGDPLPPTRKSSPDKVLSADEQYPKAVDHVDHPDPVAAAAGHQEPVVVNSPEEEKQYLEAKADEAEAAKTE